jgi:hypothetical protein
MDHFAIELGSTDISRKDWTKRTVTLEARDKQGQPIFSKAVPFAEIGAGAGG